MTEMDVGSVKTAIVTGASSGIGYAVVEELVKNGFTVYACARRIGRLEQLSRECETGKVIPYKLDISDLNQIIQLREYLSIHLPHQELDVLYNNAGQASTMPAVDETNERLNQLFQVNVIGHMNMTSQLIQFLINAKGTIVFTGSVSGICVFPFGAAYAATKAAIHQYARVLHSEMKMFGVRVINAITGGVKTDIADTSPLPSNSPFYFPEGLKALEERKFMAAENHPMSAEKYAQELVADIIGLSDPVDVYRGQLASVLSWFMTLSPYWLIEWIMFKKFKIDALEKALRQRLQTKKEE